MLKNVLIVAGWTAATIAFWQAGSVPWEFDRNIERQSDMAFTLCAIMAVATGVYAIIETIVLIARKLAKRPTPPAAPPTGNSS